MKFILMISLFFICSTSFGQACPNGKCPPSDKVDVEVFKGQISDEVEKITGFEVTDVELSHPSGLFANVAFLLNGANVSGYLTKEVFVETTRGLTLNCLVVGNNETINVNNCHIWSHSTMIGINSLN